MLFTRKQTNKLTNKHNNNNSNDDTFWIMRINAIFFYERDKKIKEYNTLKYIITTKHVT